MSHFDVAARTAAYLNTFLKKEGYQLLKTEYVTEDGIHYLRAYIDLTEGESEKRKECLCETELQNTEEPASVPEIAEASEETGSKDNEITEPGTREPGIGINDCAAVSRRLSKWLDKEDFIPDEYMLEVCSRGYLDAPNETLNEEITNEGDLK